MGKKSGSGSGMKHPDAYKTIFRVKILKIFDADPGWKKFGFGINIPDPQHCFFGYIFLPSGRIYAVQL
jgi:hypothetical protein